METHQSRTQLVSQLAVYLVYQADRYRCGIGGTDVLDRGYRLEEGKRGAGHVGSRERTAREN